MTWPTHWSVPVLDSCHRKTGLFMAEKTITFRKQTWHTPLSRFHKLQFETASPGYDWKGLLFLEY